MKVEIPFIHTILSVNRPDLLEKSLESVRAIWEYTRILDNSPAGRTGQRSWPVPVVLPSVPLTASQSLNFLHRTAKEKGALAFGYQHEDAEAQPGTVEKLMAVMESLLTGSRRWATIYTRYDILSVFHTGAVSEVGEWDTWFPNPNYHYDVDWFHRARLMGFEIIETKLPVRHMDGGSVTSKDPNRRRFHGMTFQMNWKYYQAKWGGTTHQEKFRTPWNEKPLETARPSPAVPEAPPGPTPPETRP